MEISVGMSGTYLNSQRIAKISRGAFLLSGDGLPGFPQVRRRAEDCPPYLVFCRRATGLTIFGGASLRTTGWQLYFPERPYLRTGAAGFVFARAVSRRKIVSPSFIKSSRSRAIVSR